MKLIDYIYPQLVRFDRFDNFDRLLNQRGQGNRLSPATNLTENEDNFYARIELPGVKKKEIEVKLENAVLTISTNQNSSEKDSEQSYNFSRSLSIPDGIEGNNIKANYEDGILKVTIPKAEISKPKIITVN